MVKRSLPPTASVAHLSEGARLNAPSAERNKAAITAMLQRYAPPANGKALELASGTGQHVIAFATALPGFVWQPTEPDQTRRASIDAWASDANLRNLRTAKALDACAPGWAAQHPGQNLIVMINLLHLISAPEAKTLISESAQALVPSGRLVLYGPFLRNGKATSQGDANFHASLVAQDPVIGYKNIEDVRRWLADSGLQSIATVDMPANNLALISEIPVETD